VRLVMRKFRRSIVIVASMTVVAGASTVLGAHIRSAAGLAPPVAGAQSLGPDDVDPNAEADPLTNSALPAKAIDCGTRANDASRSYDVYWLGTSFGGQQVSGVTRDCTPKSTEVPIAHDHTTFLYGTCLPEQTAPITGATSEDLAEPGGCVPPLEIQSAPTSQHNPNLYTAGVPADGQYPYTATRVNGAEAASYNDGTIVEVYRNGTTISVMGQDAGLVASAAEGLQYGPVPPTGDALKPSQLPNVPAIATSHKIVRDCHVHLSLSLNPGARVPLFLVWGTPTRAGAVSAVGSVTCDGPEGHVESSSTFTGSYSIGGDTCTAGLTLTGTLTDSGPEHALEGPASFSFPTLQANNGTTSIQGSANNISAVGRDATLGAAGWCGGSSVSSVTVDGSATVVIQK